MPKRCGDFDTFLPELGHVLFVIDAARVHEAARYFIKRPMTLRATVPGLTLLIWPLYSPE